MHKIVSEDGFRSVLRELLRFNFYVFYHRGESTLRAASEMQKRRTTDSTDLEEQEPSGEEQKKRRRKNPREITPAREGKDQVTDTVAQLQNRPEPYQPTSYIPV